MKYIVKLVAIREPTLNEVLLRSDGRVDGQGERISPDMEEAYEKFVKGSAVGKNIFADIGRALSLYGDDNSFSCLLPILICSLKCFEAFRIAMAHMQHVVHVYFCVHAFCTTAMFYSKMI